MRSSAMSFAEDDTAEGCWRGAYGLRASEMTGRRGARAGVPPLPGSRGKPIDPSHL